MHLRNRQLIRVFQKGEWSEPMNYSEFKWKFHLSTSEHFWDTLGNLFMVSMGMTLMYLLMTR